MTTMTTTNTMTPEQHTLLWNDDLETWRRTSGRDSQLEDWIVDHFEHAYRSCPRVFEAWKERTPREIYRLTLVKCIGAALENISEQEKTAVLKGGCTEGMGADLHRHLRVVAPCWKVLSPAWIGSPHSHLRQAAMELGWETGMLPAQVVHHIRRFDAWPWQEAVPYPHSMLVLFRYDGVHTYGNEQPVKQESMPWATLKDVALAQQLAALLPGKPLQFTLTAHPNVPSIDPQEDLKIQHLIEVYLSMDAPEILMEHVLSGTLELAFTSDTLELPCLGV